MFLEAFKPTQGDGSSSGRLPLATLPTSVQWRPRQAAGAHGRPHNSILKCLKQSPYSITKEMDYAETHYQIYFKIVIESISESCQDKRNDTSHANS